jgi:3-oxoadipate enol-lactonase
MSQRLDVAVGDASLAVQIDGDEGLPWLMLSNSLAADLTMWDDQLPALSRLRRVVRYDTRGHGDSSVPAGPYDFDRLTADAVAIMDHLQIRSADFLGLSLGGMTGLGLGLGSSERIRRLICCNARGEYPAAVVATWDARMKSVASGGMAAIADDTLARWFTERTRRENPGVAERARRMMLSTPAAGYCGCAAALKALDYRRHLPDLRVPTLYVAGEEDLAAPPGVMREMADATPGARLAVVPGAAHMANMDSPAVFNATVCGFLREADASPAAPAISRS